MHVYHCLLLQSVGLYDQPLRSPSVGEELSLLHRFKAFKLIIIEMSLMINRVYREIDAPQ